MVRKELSNNPETLPVFVYKSLRSLDGTSAKLIQVTKKEGFATIETGRYEVEGESVVCLSTQIGCAMKCSNCKSTEPFEFYPGKRVRILRNLASPEIVNQAVNALERIPPPRESEGIIFSYMGIGEPFANLREVLKSIHVLGRDYPDSRTTLSTIGFDLNMIYELAEDVANGDYPIPVKLHFSLHASSDEQRMEVVPYAKPLRDTFNAAEHFAVETGNKVKMNYVLVAGLNDTEGDAGRLGRLFKGRRGLVLKISDLNTEDESKIVSREQADQFESWIKEWEIETCRFSSHGTDIKAGCGELVKGKLIVKKYL
jgi:23S rRNA (adenine2503-C2)-methyltransferase